MRHTRLALYAHLVWATWDRLPLLIGESERLAHRSVEATCMERGVELIACGGVEDHVHLLVRVPATLAIADLVKQLKGASSHLITHSSPTAPFFKWQGAYGAFSVCQQHLATVSDYIARQREHHAQGTLVSAWETEEETQPS